MRKAAGLWMILVLMLPVALVAAPKQPPAKKAAQIEAAEAAKSPLQSLVSAEQAFARMAITKDTRTAFVAYLAEDCVMFRPLPVNGYDLYKARPVTAAKLAWGPVFAEVSAAGDLGVTTGPWEFTPPPGTANAEMAYGQFFSVWRRQPGKPWKVALDCGVSHARPDEGLGGLAFEAGPSHSGASGSDSAAAMAAFDDELGRAAHEFNGPRAVINATTDDLRYLAEGQPPRQGQEARNAMSAMPSRVAFHTLGLGLAKSADLGFTYGVREDSSEALDHAPDSTMYVHVWRRIDDGTWKISAAVEQPIRR
jgi:ketosteroid isomerase-like protein